MTWADFSRDYPHEVGVVPGQESNAMLCQGVGGWPAPNAAPPLPELAFRSGEANE